MPNVDGTGFGGYIGPFQLCHWKLEGDQFSEYVDVTAYVRNTVGGQMPENAQFYLVAEVVKSGNDERNAPIWTGRAESIMFEHSLDCIKVTWRARRVLCDGGPV